MNIIMTLLIAAALQGDGTTPLHWAVYKDDLQATQALIRSGANVKAANREGATVLSLACINGSAAIIEEFMLWRHLMDCRVKPGNDGSERDE